MILHNLLRIGFGERPAEHREILREYVNLTSVDQAVPGDEAVAVDHLLVHAEIAAAVADQLVHFFKRAFVEQQFDPLAGRKLAFSMLALVSARRLRPLPRVHGDAVLLLVDSCS